MRYNVKNAVLLIVVLAVVGMTSGCAGISTAIENRNPEVVTSTSKPLFLDVFESKTFFIKYRNASGYEEMDKVLKKVAQKLREKGHTITTSHEKADYIISATTMDANKVDKSANELEGSDDAMIAGGAAAGAAAGIKQGDPVATILGGVGGAAAGGLADATVNSLVTVGTINMVTDIQVAEKVDGGVETKTESVVQQGGGTGNTEVKQVSTGQADYMKYRMQAVTRVKKTSLDWDEVDHLFVKEVSRVIGNIV